MQKKYRVGYITKSHGLKGFVVVKPTTDDSYKRFGKNGVLYVKSLGNFTIEKSTIGQNKILVKFADIDRIEQTKKLIKQEVFVKIDNAKEIDEFYVDELLGFSIYNQAGDKLGNVEEIDISGPQHKIIFSKIILPFAKKLVPVINLSEKYIIVNMPEGIDKL
ncbi:MAG: ribosome maturation factor RimM [Bifidobacteriaceae bacterium]|nr:ribosome maturation factor RimM [Bifidobacteriaceae bacterium]